jgi:hypothetical protein
MGAEIAFMSVRWQCCALCRLSCGVEVILAFLSYGFKEKGKRKESKKNQTLSTVIDIHVSKDNC